MSSTHERVEAERQAYVRREEQEQARAARVPTHDEIVEQQWRKGYGRYSKRI